VDIELEHASARRAISAPASSAVGVRNRGKGGKCNMPHSGPQHARVRSITTLNEPRRIIVATTRQRTKTITMSTEPEELATQHKQPDGGRFLLQVDRQTKQSYTTYEAAEAAGTAIKKAYPNLQVAVYDGVDNVSKIVELPKSGNH